MTTSLPGAVANPPYPGPPAFITWTDAGGRFNILTFDLVKSESWKDDAEVTEHPVEQGANVADHVRVALEECTLEILSTNEPIDGNNFVTGQQTQIGLSLPAPIWTPGDGIVVVATWNNLIELRALAGALVGLGGGLGGGLGQAAGVGLNALAGALLQPYETDVEVPTSAGLLPPAGGSVANATVYTFPADDYVELTHAQLVTLKNAAQVLQVYGTKQVNLSMVIESLTFTRGAEEGTGESLTVGFKEVRIVSTQTVTAPIPNLPAGGSKPTVDHGGQTPQEPPAAVQSAPLVALKTYAPSVYNALPPAVTGS